MPIERRADAPQLVLSGEIDLVVAGELRAAGEAVIDELSAEPKLVIDLSGVTFIDSAGLGALVAIRKGVKNVGGTVALVRLRPEIARVFELSGLLHAFDS